MPQQVHTKKMVTNRQDPVTNGRAEAVSSRFLGPCLPRDRVMLAQSAELDVTAALTDDAAADERLLFWSTQSALCLLVLSGTSMVFPTLRDEPLPGGRRRSHRPKGCTGRG